MSGPKQTFDFSSFLSEVNPDLARDATSEAVNDIIDDVMGEVAPRIWCVIQEQMRRDPKNNAHLNAVLNSAVFAILSWMAACTPRGETNGRDNDEVMREKILVNLDNALANGREGGGNMSFIAQNAGKLKLLEDALKGLSNVVVSNSMIIKGIDKRLSGGSSDGSPA